MTMGDIIKRMIIRASQRSAVLKLKSDIRERLSTEDYTCRLPRPPKPRVRYKLTKYWFLNDAMDVVQVYS